MLTHWNKLLTTDCEVVKIKNEYIYPIFKNGSTALRNNAEKVYKNNELKLGNKENVFYHRFLEMSMNGF